jgi:aspartate/methionine/tyrosine aminotransferase
MSIPTLLSRPLAARVQFLPPAAAPLQSGAAGPGVIVEAQKALDAGKTHYTDRPGILPLREKISAMLGAAGMSIAPDAITVTCGTIESRFVAFRQLVPAGGSVGAHARHADALAGVTTLLGLSLITDARPASLHYALGTHEMAAALGSSSQWIVYQFTPGENLSVAADQTSRVLVIGEFAELAGWCVGYMAGSSAVNKLRAYKQSMTICTPSVSQWAALGVNTP